MALGTTPTVDEAFAALRDARSGRDPVPLYEPFLRSEGAVRLGNGDLVVAHHADVVELLRNPAFGKLPPPLLPTRSLRVAMRMFLMLDPPEHTRLRKAVAHHFSASAVASYRDRLRTLAAETLDRLPSEFDLVGGFAYPFPFAFICELIGSRPDDWHELSRWTTTLTRGLDEPLPMRVRDAVPMFRAIASGRIRPVEMMSAVSGVVRYARARVADAGAPVAEGLRTAVAAGQLSRDEAASTWVLLFMAGHETSANLIAGVVNALLTHPDELTKVRGSGDVAAAIDETMRWDPPVPLNGRVAKTTVELGGTRVEKGTFVHALVGAANRDPSAFDEPDAFRVDRPSGTAAPHLSFGQGAHFCVGAQLARAEVEAAVSTLLDIDGAGGPPVRLAGDPVRRRTFSVSGFESLPLARD